jgi:hypothetical protein
MKAIRVLLAVAVVLLPQSAFASCPDRYYGLYGPSGLTSGWYDVFDPATCPTTDSSTGTMSCYGWSANSFDPGSYARYTMTVPSGTGSGGWSMATWVDFNDPNAHSYNIMAVLVRVWHNGNISYSNTFFFHDGTQGSLNCYRIDSPTFTVADGDTIEVYYSVDNYTHATIKITTPVIFEGI